MSARLPFFKQIATSTGTDIVTHEPLAIVFGLDDQGQVWVYHNSGWSKLDKMTRVD